MLFPSHFMVTAIVTNNICFVLYCVSVVTLAPGIDVAGESLSALRFAARASKVKVSATVNRVKDYEALYREAKSKLKEFQSTTGSNLIKFNLLLFFF